MAVSSPTPSAITATLGSRRRPSSARSARSAQSTTTTTTTTPVPPTTTKAAPLARRLLFPAWPADQPLPVLLGSTDDELDAELYDFVALALRAFVHPWWSKLTRFDRDLLPRVTAILAHVLRALAVRLQAVDVPALVCLDAPALLAQHVRDHRAAAAARGTAYGAGGGAPLAQLFHQRQAHTAVGADGAVSDEYVRCAVDHILRACLPAEDCTPETERTIVREIVLMIVLRSVVPKVTQPWFIHKMILDQLGPAPSEASVKGSSAPQPKKPFSWQTVVVLFLSAVQAISSAGLALIAVYKSVRETVRLVHASHAAKTTASPLAAEEKPTQIQTPPGSRSSSTPPLLRSYTSGSTLGELPLPPPPVTADGPPDYTRGALDFVAELLTLRERFGSAVLLSFLSGSSSAAQPFLSKLIPYTLDKHVGAPLATTIVRGAKKALFPDGWPGPAPPEPSPEEQIANRKAVVQRLTERVPAAAAKLVLGPDPARTIDAALAPFDDQACNVHLVVFFLDLVLLTLFPELGVSGGDAFS